VTKNYLVDTFACIPTLIIAFILHG